jgi:hypothetical protein
MATHGTGTQIQSSSPENKPDIRMLTEQWTLLMNYARWIAIMPIEEWLEAFELAETTGPILDPTLFRDYLYSGKGDVIKSIMRAALPLKKAVLDAQPKLAEMIEKGNR